MGLEIMAKRYHQMLPLIAEVKPHIIVEVGVHRAVRAVQLCREALRHSRPVRYIGFDVFETMGEAFQLAALNGKGTPTEASARRALDALADEFLHFSYTLHVGDTRDTLHANNIAADFAFIDGDHRVDAIRGDYLALRDSKCIVFDDFYTGAVPDLDKFGANVVVDEIVAAGVHVDILPSADLCNHGGITHLAVVRQ